MANNSRSLKRIQVDKAQAVMLGLVIGASIVTVFSLMASKAFYTQARYLDRVATEKEKAVKQLKANKEAVSKLVTSYQAFAQQNPNLIGGSTTGTGDRDGDNARLVLDALPSKYDFPALATSIEKLLTGYTINEISGNDDSLVHEDTAAASSTDHGAATTSATAAVPEVTPAAPTLNADGTTSQLVEMPYKMDVTSDYAGIQRMFTTFEKSIRPFQMQTIELTGTNTKLQAIITAKTFYQPEKSLKIESKVVK